MFFFVHLPKIFLRFVAAHCVCRKTKINKHLQGGNFTPSFLAKGSISETISKDDNPVVAENSSRRSCSLRKRKSYTIITALQVFERRDGGNFSSFLAKDSIIETI